MTDDKRFTTVELPKPNRWGIWYDGAYLSTYQVCTLLNEYVDVKNKNEQLKSFKSKVFKLIDDNIKIYEDTTTNDEFLHIQLDTKLQTLYNLRKELQE